MFMRLYAIALPVFFAVDLVWLGLVAAAASYVALLPNLFQGVIGISGALLLYPFLEKAYGRRG